MRNRRYSLWNSMTLKSDRIKVKEVESSSQGRTKVSVRGIQTYSVGQRYKFTEKELGS